MYTYTVSFPPSSGGCGQLNSHKTGVSHVSGALSSERLVLASSPGNHTVLGVDLGLIHACDKRSSVKVWMHGRLNSDPLLSCFNST